MLGVLEVLGVSRVSASIKGLLALLVYLSLALSLPLKASGLELMLTSDSNNARLVGYGASLIDRASTKEAGRYGVSTAYSTELMTQRLSHYPEGTVVYIFRDGTDDIKGVFPVFPQPERLVISPGLKTPRAFKPSVVLVDVPESLIMQFDTTEVWRKSESAKVEYVGDILSAPERP